MPGRERDDMQRQVDDLSDRIDRIEERADIDRLLISQLQLNRRTNTQLEDALRSSRRIGAAIGIVMATLKVTEEVAFTLLSDASQNANRKLRDLADEVVLTGSLPAPAPAPAPAQQPQQLIEQLRRPNPR